MLIKILLIINYGQRSICGLKTFTSKFIFFPCCVYTIKARSRVKAASRSRSSDLTQPHLDVRLSALSCLRRPQFAWCSGTLRYRLTTHRYLYYASYQPVHRGWPWLRRGACRVAPWPRSIRASREASAANTAGMDVPPKRIWIKSLTFVSKLTSTIDSYLCLYSVYKCV